MPITNNVLKIKDLRLGEYTVTSFELKNSLYRASYIVDLIDGCNKKFAVWSNSYLANYITTTKPKKKFKINVEQNMIKIKKYSKKMILH